jgi:tRNA-modifying protein YgfZ
MSKWFNLPHLAAVRIDGADALAFCQAQFTADMHLIDRFRWQACAWCDPKGRCLIVILASVHEDHVELILPSRQLDLIARLRPYAIGRQARISDPLPVSGRFDAEAGDIRVGRAGPRAMQVGHLLPVDPAAELAWRIADLCEPLPWLGPSQSGRFLPQFLDLERSGGLSYKKGCYPGQEIIARVHYLGSVKQQLLGFVLNAHDAVEQTDLGPLRSVMADGQAEPVDWLALEQGIIGLAVCPIAWQAGLEIQVSVAGRTLAGQMVTSDTLCYYRTNNDYKHGTNQ